MKESRPSSKWRQSMFRKLVERDGAICGQCGIAHRTIWRAAGVNGFADNLHTRVNPSSNLEVDHKTALHVGGSNKVENLWLLCRDCHKRKTSLEQSMRLKALFAEARA